MKIKPEHYTQLKACIDSIDKEAIAEYKETLRTDPKVKDFDVRFAWDLLYGIPYKKRSSIMDEVYEYANDNHMTTALKKIVKELKL